MLAVLGAFACWKARKGLLAVWFVLTFFTDPRSAPHVIAIQVSLLAAIGLTDVFFQALARFSVGWLAVLEKTSGRVALGYVLVVMLFNAQSNLLQIGKYVLPAVDRQAMAWRCLPKRRPIADSLYWIGRRSRCFRRCWSGFQR